MTSPDSQSSPPPSDDAAPPRVPAFRTWRGLYFFVLGCFVLNVVLLAVFTRWFR